MVNRTKIEEKKKIESKNDDNQARDQCFMRYEEMETQQIVRRVCLMLAPN